ncbi:MAG: hypothetical protein H0T88_12010 [Lysobacter sp.]|nr:hypothetical protein [Lysobacter sp.]
MIEGLALAVVVATGLFFVALGGACLMAPARSSRFLLGFAGSVSKHYVELVLRFLAGGALVAAAPQMMFPRVFSLLGWVVLATTAGLLLVPWRWHHRFAACAVPAALRFLPLIGLSSVIMGVLVLLAVFRDNIG